MSELAPEKQTVSVTVKKIIAAEGNRPWKLVDANDTEYATFKKDIIEPAEALVGDRAVLEFVTKETAKDGRQFVNHYLNSVKAAEKEAAAPTLGTGDYVKGKENPSTQRSIFASVALQQAVATLAADPALWAMDNKEIIEKVQAVSHGFHVQMLRMARLMDDEDIPLGLAIMATLLLIGYIVLGVAYVLSAVPRRR